MYIHVRTKTGAKAEEVQRLSETHFVVSVREKPLFNLANKRILELIANEFGVVVGRVRIVNGHHSPSKLLTVETREA